MCNSGNITGGNPIREEKASPIQKITDVYIGVFFDGTSNNMRYISKTAINKGDKEVVSLEIVLQKLQNEKNKFNNSELEFSYLFDNIPEIPSKADKIKEDDVLFQIAEEYVAVSDSYKLSEEIRKKSTDKDLKKMHYSKYSNIAFLTSLYKGTNKKENCKVYNVYIEGSGATEFNKVKGGDSNILGLAFGLGETGVVALVSRAVKLITNYLSSLNLDKKNVKIHFDVFGFSRGATCARLLSYLVARDEKDILKREKEFQVYLKSEYFDNNRLKFLNEYTPEHVKVDFLGIYDTVASIGFLKLDKINEYHTSFIDIENKDEKQNHKGYVNKVYNLVADYSEEYRNNFHCDNVSNYGLFSPQLSRVLNTFHIGALDEYRENFAFTDCGETVPKQCIEVFIPGSHSDIGGGHLSTDINHVTLFVKKEIPKFSKTNEYKYENLIDKHSKDITELEPQSEIITSLKNNDNNCSVISTNTLHNLGWIHSVYDNKPKDLIFLSKEKKEQIYGVDFWSNPKIGYMYSNITLHMMIKYSEELTDRDMFDMDFKLPHPRIKIPFSLEKKYAKSILDLPLSKGNRYCILPKGGYASNNYAKLRRDYLHFTSTDLWNIDIGENWDKNNWGNVLDANAPYRKYYKKSNKDFFKICRIAYHGDPLCNQLGEMSLLKIDKTFEVEVD